MDFGSRFRPIILVVMTIFLLLSSVAAAAGSTPTITGFTPSEGASVNVSDLTVKFDVYDPDNISSANSDRYIKLNGSDVSSYFLYDGFWAEDTCGDSYYAVTSLATAHISANVTGLTDGVQTVEAMAKDRLGNPVVGNWTFTMAAPPVYSQMTPEPASSSSNNTSLSVKVTDNSAVDPGSVILLVDGLPVEASFDSASGIVTYTAQTPLLDGLHTIDISASDMAGNQSSTSWTYTIYATGPQLTFAGAGTTFTSSTPTLSIWAQSAMKLDNSTAVVKVDGLPVNTGFTYKGHWEEALEIDPWYVVDSYNEGEVQGLPLNLQDGTHTLAVTIKDILGNTTTSQWDFTVNARPVYSAPSPADKTDITDNSGFAVTLKDNDAVVPVSVAVYLDGGQVQAVFDPATGLLSYRPAGGIADGLHSVNVSAKDTTGNTSTFNWSFTVQTTGPEHIFADAGRTFDNHKPMISLTLKSNVKIVNTSAVMTVDGQQVNAGFTYKGHLWEDPYEDFSAWIIESYNEGTLVYNPASLSDGQHQIAVTAADILGNVSTSTWNFTVAQKPVFSGLEPTDGTVLSSKTPTVRAVISDPNGPAINQASIKLVIDNREVVPILSQSNGDTIVSYTSGTLADDSYHNISLTASDTASAVNTATVTWKFYINSKGDMVVDAKGCGSCHTINQYDKYVHSEGPLGLGVGHSSPTHFYGRDCDHCHGGYRENTCGYCHNGDIALWWDGDGWVRPEFEPDPTISAGQDCLYCHSNSNGGWIPSEYPANHFYWVNNMINNSLQPFTPIYPDLGYTVRHDILPIHKVEKGACNDCHSTYLTREHNRLDKNGSQITCVTCHQSTDPKVQQAIATNNLDCLACHTDADHEAVHVDGLDSNCQTCHKSTLSQEHLANPVTNPNKNYTCDSCHAGTSKQVKRSIASGNENCAACHTDATSHNVQFADRVPSDIPLFAGYQWSLPMETSLFAGEPNSVSGYSAGQLVLSNRRADVSAGQIWSFYNAQMLAGGWTLIDGAPADGAVYFSAEFSKGGRYVTVRCYNTELNDGAGPQSTGYRVEIWYKSI